MSRGDYVHVDVVDMKCMPKRRSAVVKVILSTRPHGSCAEIFPFTINLTCLYHMLGRCSRHS